MKKKEDKQSADQSPLAQVPSGDRDTGLNAAVKAEPAAHHEKAASHEKAAAEPLTLPRGAFIAIRRSGGLKFSTQEVVVYPDGRVTHGGGDTSKTPQSRPGRKLNDAQIVRLRRMLDQSGFFRLESEKTEQDPDSYAYEIVARVGSRSNYFECFTGSVPQSLAPLIQQLNQLL